MSSPDPAPGRPASLIRLALESIAYGLTKGSELPVDPADHPEAWRRPGACFVTLRIDGRLRGCTGCLEATRPLVVDVAANAYSAAFRDPRFAPVAREEYSLLNAKVSVLSPPEDLRVASEAELLAQLRPGIHGLILQKGQQRATFLPAVWEIISEPTEFLDALREKARLPSGYWSPSLRFARYTTTEVD